MHLIDTGDVDPVENQPERHVAFSVDDHATIAEMKLDSATLSVRQMFDAWKRRDASFDALFCFGVKTTGIFCRPSCPSQPNPANLEFFRDSGEAIRAGYRPCKRCQPELATGQPPAWVSRLIRRAGEAPDHRISTQELRSLGVSPERARRWFHTHYGMSFTAWCRGLRLSRAFTEIRSGAPLDDVSLGHGFESHSGFRSAFTQAFGRAPAKSRNSDCLRVALLATPLGPMIAAASSDALCHLEFADRRGLDDTYEQMRQRHESPVVPGENSVLCQLERELKEYFAGGRRQFTVPVLLKGTPFQERVWRGLQRIPYGKTMSYQAIAGQVGSITAVRAVARANATNRLYLVVPCHRVIGKDGQISGYGGGPWRKRLLLQLERTGTLPAGTVS